MIAYKRILNFENYQIGTDGSIWSLRASVPKRLKPQVKTNGYFTVTLYNKNLKKKCYIHRLVAETFISNPNNYPCINHKDENKSNNNVSNLEWCTNAENNQHAWSTGLYNSKFVGCKLSFDGINWIEFTSVIEAAEYLNCPVSTVRTSLDKNRKSKEHKYRCRGHIVLDK